MHRLFGESKEDSIKPYLLRKSAICVNPSFLRPSTSKWESMEQNNVHTPATPMHPPVPSYPAEHDKMEMPTIADFTENSTRKKKRETIKRSKKENRSPYQKIEGRDLARGSVDSN